MKIEIEKFNPENFDDLKVVFEKLIGAEPQNKNDLEDFIKTVENITKEISETMAWAYINSTRDTNNEEYKAKYKKMFMEIYPQLKPYQIKILKKIVGSPYLDQLDDNFWGNYKKIVKNQIKFMLEANIPLEKEESELSHKYYDIVGNLNIEFQGKEYTIQQMGLFLKSPDREVRKNAYYAVANARSKVSGELNELFTKLIQNRTEQAKNAGYSNYRDYKHEQMGRFDYTPVDCMKFHESIKSAALPYYNKILEIKKKYLKLDSIKPWDINVEFLTKQPLKPFNNSEELANGVIEIAGKIKPEFKENLLKMKEKKYFDLESRKGKAPGGYNYPLNKTGMPFIFMNAVGLHRDLTTLLHESGHAQHTFLTAGMDLVEYSETPSEVAELASMSMELITLDYLDVFYKTEEEKKAATYNQLEGILLFFPWMSSVDLFQQWVYLNPDHSVKEREAKWLEIRKEYGGNVDINGLEDHIKNSWHKQLHIFEVPFYYIEYGMAQLGALQVWKNYKNDPQKAIEDYTNALKLGYSKSIPEIYNTGNIKFDFSEELIKEIMEFVFNEIEKLV
ncbi:M3 family oligoendopeptidase [bacterium]|nr:M3 family oligoendopeptidase [bacterium]